MIMETIEINGEVVEVASLPPALKANFELREVWMTDYVKARAEYLKCKRAIASIDIDISKAVQEFKLQK